MRTQKESIQAKNKIKLPGLCYGTGYGYVLLWMIGGERQVGESVVRETGAEKSGRKLTVKEFREE